MEWGWGWGWGGLISYENSGIFQVIFFFFERRSIISHTQQVDLLHFDIKKFMVAGLHFLYLIAPVEIIIPEKCVRMFILNTVVLHVRCCLLCFDNRDNSCRNNNDYYY